MSILTLINAALQKHGWLIARLPSDEEERAAQLIELLVEDNTDGRARRHTLRPWLWYERPVRERFEGQDCCLTVEGPIYRSRDGTGYPLGSQLRTEFGWLDLTPEETNLLADEVRSAIDLALLRWFTRPDMADQDHQQHQAPRACGPWPRGRSSSPPWDATNARFSSCTAEEWRTWVANGRSGLGNFVPFDEKRKWLWSTRDAKSELSTRRFAGRFEPRYSNPDFYLDDWDFEADIWSHWEEISEEMPTVWAQVAERLLTSPRQLSAYQTGVLTERASNGHTRRVISRGLTPAWAMKLADKACLRDTHGTHRKPTELLMRAPETEALMDVEPFVHKSLDSETTKPWLKLIGVSDQPTGPEKLLARLSALASSKTPSTTRRCSCRDRASRRSARAVRRAHRAMA